MLTHWGRDKMAAIFQTTFSSGFSWMKMYEFRLTFKFVPWGPINNIPTLVQVMAWRRSGDKPLSESMIVRLPTHLCVTRPQFYHKNRKIHFNSSDAGDRIVRLRGSIQCLLMSWLLKSPEHQQAQYWLCKTDNKYCCFRVNFMYLGQVSSKIWFKMWIYLLRSLKQFSMSRVKHDDVYVSVNRVIIGSGYDFHQFRAFRTNLLSFQPLQTKLSEIEIKIFSFKKVHSKMFLANCWPFCGLSILNWKTCSC